ncbi:MAG: helix-turn-helix domain-containing protein [Mesorhizobium sp.]|nr:MAG: helix-turn-helix domain-containing protein [Mesorhizobium sp.]
MSETNSPLDMKALRKRLKWNQDRLARYLGADQSTVSRMERLGNPKGAVLISLQVLSDAADAGTADALCPELASAE